MSINAQPFNPTFKLTGNLQQDQVLVYDVSENAFVNATGNGSGGAASSLDAVSNTGTGLQLADIVGTTLEVKSIIGGSNVTISDNGSALVIDASFSESIQSGTNLGAGSGVYSGVDAATNQLRFKSIRAVGDLQISDDGNTLTISYTGNGSGGGSNVDLSNYYTKQETLSEAQSNAKYLRGDAHSLPTHNNTWDLGSAEYRFNDVYGETFQGTAILADNLSISGAEGNVLKYVGGTWVAGQETAPQQSSQTLSISGNELSISDGNTITLPVYQDADNFIKLDGHSLPSHDNTWDIGSAEYRFNDIYAETLQGTAILAENLTITGGEGDVLTSINGTWVARPASQAQIDLSDYATTTELNTAIANIVHPTIPTDVSDLTDTTSLLGQGGTTLDGLAGDVNTNTLTIEAGWNLIPATDGLQSLGSATNRFTEIYIDNSTINIGGNAIEADADNGGNLLWNSKIVATQEYVQSVLPTPFSGSYDDLTDTPTIPDVSAFIDEAAIDAKITSAVSGGSVDLSAYYTRTEVDGLIPSVFSGDYADLTNKPTIPTLDGLATQAWVIDQGFLTTDNDNQGLVLTGSTLTITGSTTSIDLSTIIPAAFSGDYSDLTNKPTLPADISDLTDTTGIIQSANTDAQALTLNGSTLQISGGNSVDLSGISGSGTLSGLTDTTLSNVQSHNFLQWNGSAWVNSYASVRHLEDVDSAGPLSGNDTLVWIAGNNQFEFKPHFNGDYNDLSNKPTIPTVPTNISDFTNDAGYITSAAVFSGSYNDLTDTPTVPVNLSDLTNVSSNTPADGHHLVWDAANNQWKPSHASTGTSTAYGDADARNAISSGLGLSYNSSTGVMALNSTVNDLLDVDTSGISNGQVLKWNGSKFVPGDDTVLTSTDQLAEGSTNLWYSDARVENVLSNSTTTDIAEGANLYYTNDRFDDRLNTHILAGTGINIVTGTNNVKTISATVSSLDFSNITNTPTTLAGYGITDNVQGPQGETGDTGPTGLTGAQGIQGPEGPKGDTGDAGIQGPQGLQGSQGPQGLKGDTGDAGADSTVPGPQGPQGLKGDTGDQGPVGPAGADSTVPGPQGDAGADGADGAQGPQGQQGPKGDTGDTGAQGPAGNDGADGADGTTDYNLLTNKPTIPSDINDLSDADGLLGSGGSETLFGLTDTTISSISNDQILSYDTSDGKWKNVSLNAHPDFFSSSDFSTAFSAKTTNDLGDVDTSGITSGQFLMWDGSKFIAQTVNSSTTVDLTNESIDELSDVDTSTNSPVNGDVLTWDSTANSWSPAAVTGGGGGGSSAQYFKVNYATNGSLQSITNTTSDVSASILSSTGGDVEITFNTNFPPASILIYGYAYQSNEYVVQPFNKDITTRKIAGGGTQGSPTAFGNFSGTTMTLKLREADTGSSRSFGTTTHAWIMFSMA